MTIEKLNFLLCMILTNNGIEHKSSQSSWSSRTRKY